jgi:uncharacterized OB-fold protein
MAATSEPTLPFRDFPGTGDPAHLLPASNELNAPFFEGLREGRLALQGCSGCGRLRYPIGPVCPYCGGEAFAWKALSGKGIIHSWIRYRRSYLPALESLIPYVVIVVALDEGARIFGRLAEASEKPYVGMPVRAIVERWPGGECVHAFVQAV